jgi:hypothetical protein
MRWNKASLLALPAIVSAHGAHHHHQEVFSQERLDELEQKWGTDVSYVDDDPGQQLTYISGASVVSLPTPICLTRVA